MKHALVTGGSAGIGKETARALAGMGYDVVIAARDATKGQAVVERIRDEHPEGRIAFWTVDLSEPEQVVNLAQRVRQRWERLDALVLNAGLFTPRLTTSISGFETMFATTHLGHFLLTHHLLPLMMASPDGRIVVTSSLAHHLGGSFDFDSLRQPSPSTFVAGAPLRAYGRSKLANLLFVRELARRLGDTAVLVNAFHPGGVRTELWRDTPGWLHTLLWPGMVSEQEGAQTQIYLATDPGLTQTGQYWVERTVRRGSRPSRDPVLARRLWAYSEQAMGITEFGAPDAAREAVLRQANG
jgi:NAD(P)-dependent dehydrogenase (short-subunit alcohol dehydrogenase family)